MSAAAPAPAAPPPPARVLSIQSHVVAGYVGNRAAVFPLQRLGLEVDAINSVQFSNHTGYPSFAGAALTAAQLAALLDGLAANGLLAGRYTHLLTGYLPGPLAGAVAAAAARLAAANPGLVYVCDPVIGDEGRLYCAPELPARYKAEIVPLAAVLTPNQFEAELLTGQRIVDVGGAAAVCAALHAMGPPTVVLTSLALADAPGELSVVASTTAPQAPGRPACFRVRVPRLPGYFTGAGDLFAALLLAWTHRRPGDLAAAVELAVAGLQAVLQATAAAGGGAGGRGAAAFAARELRLVECGDALAVPVVSLRAEALD